MNKICMKSSELMNHFLSSYQSRQCAYSTDFFVTGGVCVCLCINIVWGKCFLTVHEKIASAHYLSLTASPTFTLPYCTTTGAIIRKTTKNGEIGCAIPYPSVQHYLSSHPLLAFLCSPHMKLTSSLLISHGLYFYIVPGSSEQFVHHFTKHILWSGFMTCMMEAQQDINIIFNHKAL